MFTLIIISKICYYKPIVYLDLPNKQLFRTFENF